MPAAYAKLVPCSHPDDCYRFVTENRGRVAQFAHTKRRPLQSRTTYTQHFDLAMQLTWLEELTERQSSGHKSASRKTGVHDAYLDMKLSATAI